MAPKKRCQYRIVYNIPSIPKPDESGSTPSTDAKPEMTANPTQCPSAALKIVGECPHCSKAFCGNHRTPESHNCTGMQACRDAAFEANKARLENERTVAAKIARA